MWTNLLGMCKRQDYQMSEHIPGCISPADFSLVVALLPFLISDRKALVLPSLTDQFLKFRDNIYWKLTIPIP